MTISFMIGIMRRLTNLLVLLSVFASPARGGGVVTEFQQPSFADTEASTHVAVPSFEG